jgi:hypothetical protein
MATDTDTHTAETTTPAREPLRPPKTRRGTLTWAAVIAAFLTSRDGSPVIQTAS